MDLIELNVEVLELEEKKRNVEKIKKSSEYKKLESLRNKIAEYVEDVQKVKVSITNASTEEARNMVSTASNIIDKYFRRS